MIDHTDDPYPVIWEHEEGTFVWQGLISDHEWFTHLGFTEGDTHDHIYQSGGVWSKAFEHEGDHLLRFDPNFPFPILCYCLKCGKRDIPIYE
jgi:hypothetical protein